MQPINLTGTKERGLGVPNVSQEEMMWHNRRPWLRGWAEAASLHHQRGIDLAYHFY